DGWVEGVLDEIVDLPLDLLALEDEDDLAAREEGGVALDAALTKIERRPLAEYCLRSILHPFPKPGDDGEPLHTVNRIDSPDADSTLVRVFRRRIRPRPDGRPR